MGTNVNLSGKEDGNNGGSSSHQGGGGGAGGDTASSGVRTSNGPVATTSSATAVSAQALKHDPGLTADWTGEEQATLEEMLSRYASDPPVVRYAKVAKHLPEKTVRDVALRSRWMTKKESGKRRKDDLSRKSKDKKERTTDSSAKPSSNLGTRPNAPPYAMPMLPMENDDDISCKAIGGPTGQLLEHTAQIFNQISGNFNNFQINDNISLFCQARDNIVSIMNELDDVPGIMRQMPALPVRLNEELANSILPRAPIPPPA